MQDLIEELIKAILKDSEQVKSRILQGHLEDFSQYKYLSGVLKGKEDSIELIKSAYSKYITEEEDK